MAMGSIVITQLLKVGYWVIYKVSLFGDFQCVQQKRIFKRCLFEIIKAA